jgi:hypothetical protein
VDMITGIDRKGGDLFEVLHTFLRAFAPSREKKT